MGVSKNSGVYPQNGWFIMVPSPIEKGGIDPRFIQSLTWPMAKRLKLFGMTNI